MQRVNTIDISNVLQLEKTLSTLLNKMISSKPDLENWLKEQSKVIWDIEEQLRSHYIAFQCNTDDEEIKDTFEHDQQFVKPLLKRYQNLLDNKYLESPFRMELDSNLYGLLDTKIKNAQKLFCEENIELEIKEDKLITEYFEITGGLSGIWDGEEKTITELQSYLQDSNRDTRKKAKTIISEQFLSVEKELQNILNQLIEIRHQKAKNIQLENYRDYMFKKYERFDYSAKDCYELAKSIRKYVVPLKDKILLEKKDKLQVDTLRPWDVSAVTPDQKVLKPIANENDLIEKSTHIFNKLDVEFSALLNRMYKHNCLDLTSRKGKVKCTPIVRHSLTIGGAFFMAKFSSKEKIQAVKRYLDGTESGKTIAKSIGVNPSVLREWIRRYESSGEKAFEKCYTFYPAQYKLDVLYYMNEHGTSIRETAALFNI
ncbi:oligoendopeptidase, M3 family, partial [Bacillus sp. ok061]